MKPGLAILPLEVWADVFVHPWITREELAKIVDKFKNRKFVEKLQFRLHDMGKHTLHYLTIDKCYRGIIFYSKASPLASAVKCEFPETEMPENIRGFRQLAIEFVDDQVLDFLGKIKPLLTNVVLDICAIKSTTPNVHILFGHLLPILASICRINCENYCLELLEHQFPETLAEANELHLPYAQLTSIPAYMNWLCAPQQHSGQHGPRFLKASANFATITAIVDAVRQQFLSATNSALFIIFLDFNRREEQHNRLEEFTIENVATKEELTVRTAYFQYKVFNYKADHYYVEIVRNPKGAITKMQEWIKERAHYEKKFNNHKWEDEAEQKLISLGPCLTIGRITNNAGAVEVEQPGTEAILFCPKDLIPFLPIYE